MEWRKHGWLVLALWFFVMIFLPRPQQAEEWEGFHGCDYDLVTDTTLVDGRVVD